MTVHQMIADAREAQASYGHMFAELRLPLFESQLLPLISFPSKLAQACLRLRLVYIRKIERPEGMIVDQLMDALKLGIGLACTLKGQYEDFLSPDPTGRWNVPECLSPGYDETILEAVRELFKILHLKLKAGNRSSYFKETDLLEAQWATLNDVSMMVTGGAFLVAEQLW